MAVKTRVSRLDWISAAAHSMRKGGVDAVVVDALARVLDVTKGSFYWHFRDRAELLDELLRLWEHETDELIAAAQREAVPLDRVLGFFELVVRGRGQLPDTEYFSWARRDPRVAQRINATESKRIAFIRDQLIEAGIGRIEARRGAEAAYLSTLGWIERASRSRERSAPADLRDFTEYLFRSLFSSTGSQKHPTPAMWRRRASGQMLRIRATRAHAPERP